MSSDTATLDDLAPEAMPGPQAATGGAGAPPASMSAIDRIVINVLLASTFVVMLNETAMSVAIPNLMQALNATASEAQWLTTAFLLTMAVVIPVTGFLLQRLNSRPVFMLAMVLFSAGTLVAALAPNLWVLVVARVVQASGTAVMMPLMMTTVMTLVPPHERGKMMGNISIVMSVAPAIGPAFAGLVIQYLDWRWIFIIVLPIALAALALGYRLMRNISEPRYAPLDVLSVILSAVAFGGVVYGLSALGGEGSSAGGIPAWAPLAVGIVTMVVFVLRQLGLQQKDGALLDLRTLKSGNYAISMTMISIMMLAMFGTIILLPIYLAQIQHFETINIGLLMLPGSLMMAFLGPVVGRLYDRVGPRPLIIPAIIVVSAVLWAMTLLGTQTWWPMILVGHIVMSLGFAFLFGPLFTASLSSVPPQLYSHGSALLGSIQQVAGAAGVALFVALMSSQTASLAATGLDANEALAGGIRLAFIVGAVISLLAVLASFFVKRPPAPQGWGGH